MLGRSRRWKLAGAALALACTVASAPAADAADSFCLPPFVDGGHRLHPNGDAIPVLWLALTLRQHELCWRRPAHEGELRVLVIGSSGAFGIRLPAERTLAGELDRRFDGEVPGVHFFNLAHAYAYQLKDALILREALRFDPDFVIYTISLSDYLHQVLYLEQPLQDFFDRNRRALAEFADEHPEGLEEVIAEQIRQLPDERPPQLTALRQIGHFVRQSVRYRAERLRAHWYGEPVEPLPVYQPPKPYDCAEVLESYPHHYWRWKEWSVLPWLARVRRETGVGVLVVNWPVARDRIGECINSRYPAFAVFNFNRWLREETLRLDLPYVDLGDFLPREEIFDSMHLTAEGHRRIAERLEPVLREQLRGRD